MILFQQHNVMGWDGRFNGYFHFAIFTQYDQQLIFFEAKISNFELYEGKGLLNFTKK